MRIADRLLRPFAARARRRAEARASATARATEARAAASAREVSAHTAALAHEIEAYALLVARSERVPADDAVVPASAPRAGRALKAARRDHADFRAAWEGLDGARDAVRARLADPATPDVAKGPAGRRFRPLEARHPDTATMRRRDNSWRARIGRLERIAGPAPTATAARRRRDDPAFGRVAFDTEDLADRGWWHGH